jgi:hypothetical protein
VFSGKRCIVPSVATGIELYFASGTHMKTGHLSLCLRTALFLLLLSLLVAAPAFAQSRPAPPTAEQAQSDDISGMYSFLREGEFVQVNIEQQGVVSGFISRYGETESDKGAFLDQFFEKASFANNHLQFKTKPVHGTWYEFDGNVERGPGKTPTDDAYRVIRGKLTQHEKDSTQKEIAKSRDVEFKSFPQDYADDKTAPAKKD